MVTVPAPRSLTRNTQSARYRYLRVSSLCCGPNLQLLRAKCARKCPQTWGSGAKRYSGGCRAWEWTRERPTSNPQLRVADHATSEPTPAEQSVLWKPTICRRAGGTVTLVSVGELGGSVG